MSTNLIRKINKFIFVFILAIVLVFINVYAVDTGTESSDKTYTVTVEGNNVEKDHTYEAYQIFVGDLYYETNEERGTNNTPILSNITWGTGIDSTKLLEALKADNTFKEEKNGESKNLFEDCEEPSDGKVASKVAKIVDAFENDSDKAKAFASHVGECLKNPVENSTSSYNEENNQYTISGLKAGYYFIKDKDESLDGKYSAYTRYILKVVNSTTIKPKSEKPSLDKSLDEKSDTDVANHAINESFKFYLTATLPANKEFDEYKTYKLVFTDTMSEGITFEGIDSVTINDNEIEKNEYEVSSPNAESTDNMLTVTIKDIKNIKNINLDFNNEIKVVVTYSVHLNENAVATKYLESGEQSGSNSNEAKLAYSNDPNWKDNGSSEDEPMGETPSDKNFVFTYEVDNTKYADDEEHPLQNAGFKLYNENGTKEIPVKKVEDGTTKYYVPIGEEENGEELVSDSDGKFNIKGLNEGTYILRETSTPGGYNTCDDITIVIKPEISEEADGNSAKVSFDSTTQNMNNKIINVHGVDLPSTGATTLVIICGLSAILGVVGLVLSKKDKEE